MKKWTLGRKLFGRDDKEVDILAEEAMQSQFTTVVKRLLSKPVNVAALAVFLFFLVGVLIGPVLLPLDENYQDMTQQNIGPGRTMLDIPGELEGHVKQISVGSTYSVGVSDEGKLYIWGKTQVTKNINLAEDIPEDMGKIRMAAAGYDHVVAVNEQGEIFCWGNNRLKQCDVPRGTDGSDIEYLEAGYQFTVAITSDGNAVTWGNSSIVDMSLTGLSGKLKKIVFTSDSAAALLTDGTVAYLGRTENALSSNVPEGKAVDLAATAHTLCAVMEDGSLYVWGQKENNLEVIPEISGRAVAVESGRYHYTALTEDGQVYSWGKDNYGQATVSASAKNVTTIYSGYFQNYAVTEDGQVATWGLKGYLLGSDGYGRDVFTRLLNGGRMTMTIGCISVIISTVIGVIIGGVSGYFGGKVDMLLMRFEEIVASLPFLPFAMILSAIVGNRISETGRIFMIMVILGVLSWTGICRLVRAQVLAEREKEYVLAAKAMGVKEWALIVRHIIPNVLSVVIVDMTLSFASCMLTESGLSYLGFGVAEPRPTWGNMLSGCNDSIIIQYYWWRWVFPAIALGLNTIAINVIGDGMRDAIDPKTEER